jgi:hypothetical protein
MINLLTPVSNLQVKTTFAHILCSFIVVFASIRGLFVYHLGFPSNITYSISALMILGLGVISLMGLLSSRLDVPLVFLKNVVILNVICFIFLTLSYFLIGLEAGVISKSMLSMFYFFLVFPTVFVFLRCDAKLLDGIVYIISFFTVVGVYYFFNLGLSGGYDAIKEAHSIMRPGDFRYSRLGINLLPFGYSASHHDTANILVMCGIFFLSKFFICSHGVKSLLYLCSYFVILSAALLTGSAANVLVLIFMSTVGLLFYVQKSLTTMLVSFSLLLGSLFLIILLVPTEILTQLFKLGYVFGKFDTETMDPNLWAGLDAQSIEDSMLSVVFGFGETFNSPLSFSEVGFLGILSRIGLLPFIIFMSIGFSPIYYFFVFRLNRSRRIKILKSNITKNLATDFIRDSRVKKFQILMLAMPALAGFLTLIHYGSVLRITSIGLLCVLLSIFFKEYVKARKSIESYSLEKC